MFANALKHVVQFTLLLPMCEHMSRKNHVCRKYVKTRCKIYSNFANVSKHVVKLTFVLQMCQNTSHKLYYFCHHVKKCRKINIMSCQCVKTRRANYIMFTNVLKYAMQLALLLPMCKNTS